MQTLEMRHNDVTKCFSHICKIFVQRVIKCKLQKTHCKVLSDSARILDSGKGLFISLANKHRLEEMYHNTVVIIWSV